VSFVDELRAVRDQVLATSSKTIGIPGSQGKLAVRFRPPPPEDEDARARLTQVVAAYMVNGALSREQELQLIVDCCDEILHRNAAGELEGYDPPLRFDGSDERWTADTARDAVGELYNLDLQPLAAAGHADALVDWLQGVDAEAAARVEGKSAPAAAS
jgi:hypothetical protein